MTPWRAELDLARHAATAAGEYLATLETREVLAADGRDLKLAADKGAEEILFRLLGPSGYPILSEETPAAGLDRSGPHWIIDPLDGTHNFFKGLRDLCCTSVALWNGETPVLGVVNKFAGGEVYAGAVGGGAFVNDVAVTCSGETRVARASCATGFSVKGDFSPESLARNVELFRRFKKIRMLGAGALSTAYVGVGRIDAYFERDILLWDIAAGAALVAAGGGEVDYRPKSDHRCDLFCFATAELRREYEGLFK